MITGVDDADGAGELDGVGEGDTGEGVAEGYADGKALREGSNTLIPAHRKFVTLLHVAGMKHVELPATAIASFSR